MKGKHEGLRRRFGSEIVEVLARPGSEPTVVDLSRDSRLAQLGEHGILIDWPTAPVRATLTSQDVSGLAVLSLRLDEAGARALRDALVAALR